MSRIAVTCLATVATVALAAAMPARGGTPAASLTAAEERGRTIYRSGVSPRGTPIVAVTAEGAVELPAASMPCSGCHGRDGRGSREGGVAPSDLTWGSLTKPYGGNHPGGRTHPPYTARLLKRAISLGLDPAGNPLHVVMPRYRMSQEDMEDLTAYIQRLGHEPVPGLSGDKIRVGTLLPPGPAAEPVRRLLDAYFTEVNARGGVFGRRLELLPMTASGAAGAVGDRRVRIEEALDREPVFALAGAFLGGADKELAALFQERELPVVGAIGSGPVPGEASPPVLFHLLSGLEGQSRALVQFAAQDAGEGKGARPKLASLAAEEPALTALVDAVEREAKSRSWVLAGSSRYRPGALDAAATARALRDSGADLLFFAGPGADQGALLAAADALGWRPRVLSPGALGGSGLFAAPPAFHRRLFLSFPTLPQDQSPAALADYQRLAAGAGLPRGALPAQLSALAAARLLVAMLERAGRDLTREALITQLEKLDHFETGLLPPLTYGPGRRIGARGAYVVAVDLEKKTFTPASGWIGVD
ncbi:MAG TPA: ABC transporter substrate-binding protein [Thermoanaerobaculia bacterium]|nr:ABC transporter substrate-binding protein [Thermoanaerobaculia bacterium]